MRALIITVFVLVYFCDDMSILAGKKGMTEGEAQEAKNAITKVMGSRPGSLPLQVVPIEKDDLKPFICNYAYDMVEIWKSVQDNCTDVLMIVMPEGTPNPAAHALKKLKAILKPRPVPKKYKQPGDRIMTLEAVDHKKSPLKKVEYNLGKRKFDAEGSYGEIHFGHDVSDRRKQAAIKIAKDDNEFVEGLEREAKIYYVLHEHACKENQASKKCRIEKIAWDGKSSNAMQEPGVSLPGIPEFYCFGDIVNDEINGKEGKQPTSSTAEPKSADGQPRELPPSAQPAQSSKIQSSKSSTTPEKSSTEAKSDLKAVPPSGPVPRDNPPDIENSGKGGPPTLRQALAIERLNYTLFELFYLCARHFSLKTTIMIAEQLVDLIKTFHQLGLSHNDIKPENILIGPYTSKDADSMKKFNTLHLVDYGLTMAFTDWNSNMGIYGTPAFLGLNRHSCRPSTKWDDFQSLWFMLNLFLRGSLPWCLGISAPPQKPHQHSGFMIHGDKGSGGFHLEEKIKVVEGVPEVFDDISVDKQQPAKHEQENIQSEAQSETSSAENGKPAEENTETDGELNSEAPTIVVENTEETNKNEINNGEQSNTNSSDKKAETHSTTNLPNAGSDDSDDNGQGSTLLFFKKSKMNHLESLAAAFPVELTIFRDYVFPQPDEFDLGAWEKRPLDYEYLKNILNLLFIRMGFDRDEIFDWVHKLQALDDKNLFGLGYSLKDFGVHENTYEHRTVLFLLASNFYAEIYSEIMKRRQGLWKLQVTNEKNKRAKIEAVRHARKPYYSHDKDGRLTVGTQIQAKDLDKLLQIFEAKTGNFLNECKDTRFWTIGFGYHYNPHNDSYFILTIIEEDFPVAVINKLRRANRECQPLGRANDLMPVALDYAKLKANSYDSKQLISIDHCTIIYVQINQTSIDESHITHPENFKTELTKAIQKLDRKCKDNKDILIKDPDLGGIAYAIYPQKNNKTTFAVVLLAPMFYRLPLQTVNLWRQDLNKVRINSELMFEAKEFAERNCKRGACILMEDGRFTVACPVDPDKFAHFFDAFHAAGLLHTKLIRNPTLESVGFGFKYDKQSNMYYCVMILSDDVVAAFSKFRNKNLPTAPELMKLAKKFAKLRAEGKEFGNDLDNQEFYMVAMTMKQLDFKTFEHKKKIDFAELLRILPSTERERLLDPHNLEHMGYGFQRQYQDSDCLHFVFLLMTEAMEFAIRENRKDEGELIIETGLTTIARFYGIADFGKAFETMEDQAHVKNEHFECAGFGFGYCTSKNQYYLVVILSEDVRDTVLTLTKFKFEGDDVKQLASNCAERIVKEKDYTDLVQDTNCKIFSLELQRYAKTSDKRKRELLEYIETLVNTPGNQLGQLNDRNKFSGMNYAFKRRQSDQTLHLVIAVTRVFRKAMLYANEKRSLAGLYDLIPRLDLSGSRLPGNFQTISEYNMDDSTSLEDMMLSAMKKVEIHLHNIDVRFIRIHSKQLMQDGNLIRKIILNFDEYSFIYLDSVRDYFENSGILFENLKTPNFEDLKVVNRLASEVVGMENVVSKLDAFLEKMETTQVYILEEKCISTDSDTNLSSIVGNVFESQKTFLLKQISNKYGPDVFMITLGCAVTKNGKPKVLMQIKTYFDLSIQFLNSKRRENSPLSRELRVHPENAGLSKLFTPRSTGEKIKILRSQIEGNEKLKNLTGSVSMSMSYDVIHVMTQEERCLAMVKQALLNQKSSKLLDKNITHVGFVEHRNAETKEIEILCLLFSN